MGVIKEKILLIGEKTDLEVETLFDSGATYSFIRKDLALKLGHISKTRISRTFQTAENDRKIIVDENIGLNFVLDKETLSDDFLVSDVLSYDAIIGAFTMQKFRLKLDFENDSVIVNHDIAGLLLI
ncbi:MAG: hypothetical protein QG635_55 [Bacteroidota bacterium]|nr:hypothetical protein [Bacteroidota bacterium]